MKEYDMVILPKVCADKRRLRK